MEKDLLSWVENSPLYPKVYWKERGSSRIRAALGAKEVFHTIPPPSTGLCFGCACPEKNEEEFSFFRTPFFFSPQYYVEETGFETLSPSLFSFPLSQRTDIPDLKTWKADVQTALHWIQQKKFDKVVLSRHTHLSFSDPINPFQLFKMLLSYPKDATYFLLQLSEEEYFLGASPEKLYSRKGTTLMTEALAGTKPRGKTEEEDKEKKRQLLTSLKERREFIMVKQYIDAQLAPLCYPLKWDEDRLVSTPTVHHLFSTLKATLKKAMSDDVLIPLLHPTPAIAGFPRPDAVSYLHKEERLERGWFASPIGWISEEESDLAIAIRSGQIRGKEMVLFAGAGILSDSNPEEEWNELNYKISTIYRE